MNVVDEILSNAVVIQGIKIDLCPTNEFFDNRIHPPREHLTTQHLMRDRSQIVPSLKDDHCLP